MSSGGGVHGQYWCYRCNVPVQLRGEYPICPYCDGAFVLELHEGTSDRSGDVPDRPPRGPTIVSFLDGVAEFVRHHVRAFNSLDIRPVGVVPPPRLWYGPYLERYGHPPPGTPYHESYHSSSSGRPGRGGHDYYNMTRGLNERMEHLSVRDRRVSPPRPSVVAPPPTPDISVFKIKQEHVDSDATCPICQEKFELGKDTMILACKHMYHPECLHPWIIEHKNNSCPVCRYKLTRITRRS